MEFPIIETDNLLLRNLRETDADAYAEYATDPDVQKKFRFTYTEESARKRIVELAEKYKDERLPKVWAIATKQDDNMVGIISIDSYSIPNKNASLAFGIITKHRNHGYATEAGIGLTNYLFKIENVHRVQLACNEGFITSRNCIKRIGAIFEGIARDRKIEDDEFVNSEIYAVLNGEGQYMDMPCKLINKESARKIMK